MEAGPSSSTAANLPVKSMEHPCSGSSWSSLDGSTPLHLAAALGRTKGIMLDCEMFLHMINVNSTNDKGETPLFAAIYGRHWETVYYLIEKGANVTWRAKSGITPMHVAAMIGTKKIVRHLLDKLADPLANSSCGTPLHCAASSGNSEVLTYLLELHADANCTNSSLDMSPLFMALANGHLECCELLLKAGADPNRASYLITPLRFAVALNDERLFKRLFEILLTAGANPNMLDPVGCKPIEHAAWDGRLWAVEGLFQKTSGIEGYTDWSIFGIIQHAESEKGKEALFKSKKKIVSLAKAKGEEAVNKEEYFDALNWYSQANVADKNDAEILSNMSLCHTMMFDGTCALKFAQACIELEPRWAMAHYREGAAFKVLKKFKEAKESFSKFNTLKDRFRKFDE